MGINVESQTVEFYEGIGGNCEYEAFLASVGTVQGRDYAVNPAAKPWTTKKFWEELDQEFAEEGQIIKEIIPDYQGD